MSDDMRVTFNDLQVTFDGDSPEWQRTVFIAEDTGEVFIPAAMGGNEMIALLSAGYDGVEACRHQDHVYLPAEWMRTYLKDWDDVIDKLYGTLRKSGHLPLDYNPVEC